MARRYSRALDRDDARNFLMMGAIFFPSGLVLLLITGLAGIGLMTMGLFLLVIGGYYRFL